MSDQLDTFYAAALKHAKLAGQLIKKNITNRNKTVQKKSSDIDLVTETDQEVENLLRENLKNDFPEHLFIGEEAFAAGGHCNLTDSPTWIIDPIDGTMNFVHQFPHSCISIALFVNKIPQIGIIYNPVKEELFTAKRGQGAYLNDRRIHVSGETKLANSLIMMEFGTSKEQRKLQIVSENQKALMQEAHGLRALGSAALDMAMVALGAADAYFEFGIHIWDIAAGELLVTEAGGVIMDPSGGAVDRLSRRVLVASSQELANQLSAKLIQFYPTPTD